MKNERRIRRVQEVVAYTDAENPWLRLYFDHVQFPDGRAGRYNRIVESGGMPGVAILPYRHKEVGLVRQFRYPIGEAVWEIPRGFAESRDCEAEALRELMEETGLVARTLTDLGSLHPNTGILASAVRIFAAEIAPNSEAKPRDVEISEFRWFELEEIETLIASDEIRDGFTMSALLRSRLRGIVY